MKKTILIVLLTLLMGFFQILKAVGSSQEQQNMEVVKKVFEVFKTKDINSLDNLMGKNFPEQAAEVFKHWWKQFSEVKSEIKDIFASGDKVAVRWTYYGIKDRELEENWQFHFISIFQLAHGKVADMWHGDDVLKVLRKHGFTIKPPAPKTFEGKLRATMSDMQTIGTALKYHIEDYNQAPKANSIKELSKILQPFYIKTLPLADAWENEILYKVDPKNPKNYWIGSPGSDGKFEGFDQKGTWKFEEGEKGQDVVLANGDFTYKPDLEEKKKEWSFVELQKENQKATMIAIKSMANAIRSYIIDHHKAPEAKTFARLQTILSPRYIKNVPLKDAWGNDFHYYHGTGDKKYEYAIGSAGNDGVFNGWDQSGFYWVTTLKGFDNDIILTTGRFVYGPVTKSGTTKSPPQPPKTFEGRLRATMGDMFTIGKALKYHIEDYNQAPKANSIKELSTILQPFYIKTLPLADAWGNELLYKVDPGDPGKYWVGSPGSDGKFQGFNQKGTWKFEKGEKGQDIVLANGDFTYMPDLEEKKKK